MSSKSAFIYGENQNPKDSLTDDPSSNVQDQGDGDSEELAETKDHAKVLLPDFLPLVVSQNYVSNISAGDGINMTLRIRQQPQRARMIGFAEKDRRPIDPPPVVELMFQNKTGERIE
jgi:hypothetical protein